MIVTGGQNVTPPPVTSGGGGEPQMFIEGLAERAAYERGAVRLYEGLLAKLRMEFEMRGNCRAPEGMTEARLMHLCYQEAAHCALLCECIASLGGDSRMQTPGTEQVGVEISRLVRAISDPESSLAQSLHVLLAAELVDDAGWKVLIDTAQGLSQETMARRFREALKSEQEHLRDVHRWYNALEVGENRLV